MKHAGLKTYSIPILVLMAILFSIFAVYVLATVTPTPVSPIGGAWLTSYNINFTFSCSGNTTVSKGNDTAIFNASIWTNMTGTWDENETLYNATPVGTTNFVINVNASSDSNDYVYSVRCMNNQTSESTFSANQTFRLDTTDPTAPTINWPKNGTFITDLTPFVNWTLTTETNFKQYKIQFSNDSDFQASDILKEQIISVRTTNSTNFTESLADETFYYMRILAEDSAGNTNYNYINVTTTSAAPTISISNYTNNTYFKNDSILHGVRPTFAITATHRFIDTCQLYLTNETTTGAEGWSINVTVRRTNGSVPFPVTNNLSTGIYKYGFVCNSSSGAASSFTANRTITVDTDLPSTFGCIDIISNNSKSIDHTPELRWNVSPDLNFGYYTVWISDSSSFAHINLTANVTTNSTTFYEANLKSYNSTDRSWYWKVNVTDLAGNTREADNCTTASQMYYRTDITNHYLLSGWNVVAIMQSGTVTSAQLGNGLGTSWVTISRYNQSKEFLNYNNGSTTNNDMSFKKGDVAFFNVNADTYWENQTWDTSANYNAEGLYNLTNTTNDWNVFGVQNQSGRTMGNIELLIIQNNIVTNHSGIASETTAVPDNFSLQVMDYFNNTAISTKKFVVHPYNYSLNNLTTVDFGEVVWINFNSSYNLTTSLGEVGYFTVNRSRVVT